MNTECQKITVYDTTLRDGEQAPGFSMSPRDKVRFAEMLVRLGVNVIEAGFPVSSEGDFTAVSDIAQQFRGVEISALARAVEKDIDTAARALEKAEHPRIHVFISTSEIHMKHQLNKDRAGVLEKAVKAVQHARSFVDYVQFSAMDATRSDREFLVQVFEQVIEAGAATVNISDTVGYTVPSELYALVKSMTERIGNIDKAVLSVHCHNDLGLATANTITAVQAGARQIEVTVNGIGERAGNASLQEVTTALQINRDIFRVCMDINMNVFEEASLLLHDIIPVT